MVGEMRKTQVTVIGNRQANTEQLELAYRVGGFIASLNHVLITGGRGGVMEAASKGARDQNGFVLGIIPGSHFDEANAYCDVVIPTGMGHMRNALNIQAADVVVAIGGAAGTLSELAFAWILKKPSLCFTNVPGWSTEMAERASQSGAEKLFIGCRDFDTFTREIEKITHNYSPK
ncbi:MAG TPA: TIGR00725 family protein [Cytophagales bacterium]|jgi:uncharacterized protein (TIGR00725 family)|nr:TIGR00725 family protein [Cytophagales bacterium]